MIDINDKLIGDLVTEDYRKAGVFTKYGLDFCCGGGMTLSQACALNNVDMSEVLKELSLLDKEPVSGNRAYNEWTTEKLIGHIVDVHHRYIRENIPMIKGYAGKVSRVHGRVHPEVVEIERLFEEMANELYDHMHKEETVLFPYIRHLGTIRKGARLPSSPFGAAGNPIKTMQNEHESVGKLLREIRRLSRGHIAPPDACNTYKALYAKLKEFEEDLLKHIHLENNILFQRAILLESGLRS